jgi:hypothetical protein
MDAVAEVTVSPLEALEKFIRDEDAFTKAFKHKLTDPNKLGKDCYGWDEKLNTFGLVTPNGSRVLLRFYDTVKPIFDYQNVEVPGKESFLSYLEVVVYPVGMKAYLFRSDLRQVVWGDAKTAAKVKHDHGLFLLGVKAKALGFELTEANWRHNYDRTSY